MFVVEQLMTIHLIKCALFTTHIVSLIFSFETADVFPTNHVALAVLITLRDPENEDLGPFHSSRQETSGMTGNGNARKASYGFHLLSLISDA